MIIPIVFSTDDNYVLPLSVAIQSLKQKKRKGVELKIFIFYDNLKKENIDLLLKMNSKNCSINFVKISEYFKNRQIYVPSDFSLATYYRLVAPKILKSYKKIIYLDCDLIVRDCVSELIKYELGENIIAGVKDVFFTDDKYINAGVLIINVEPYLENNIFEKCIEFIEKKRNLKCFDQDALNFVCRDKIFYIKSNFNYLSSSVLSSRLYIVRQGIYKINELKIIHFVSEKKPWLYKNFPFANLWWKETKKLPKEIKKQINEKYRKNLKNDKFDDGAFKYMFGSKIYQFYVNISIKLRLLFKKNKTN